MGTPNQKKLATIKSSVLLPVQDTDEPYGEQLKYLPVTDLAQGGTAGNVVTTLAEFRASDDIPTNRIVTTTDFGGGSWYYVGLGDGIEVDNTANVIITADNRVWKRMPNEILNVINFGAIPDGITDCAAFINSAIDYAKRLRESSGLLLRGTTITVRFPPGEYYISTPIYAAVGIDLVGDGQNTSIIKAASKFISAIIFNETGIPDADIHIYSRISNLGILGGSFLENPFAFKDNTISYIGVNGIEIHNHRVYIEHCTIAGWNESGITASSVYEIHIAHCLIMNNRIGYHITSTSTSNYLTNSEVRFNAIGVVIDGNSFGNFIHTNTIESNIANFFDPEPDGGSLLAKGKAFLFNGASHNKVYDNYIENHTVTFGVSNASDNHVYDNIIVPAPTNTLTDGVTDIVTYYYAPFIDNSFVDNSIDFYDFNKKANIRIFDETQNYSSNYHSFSGLMFDKVVADNISKWVTQFSANSYAAPIIEHRTSSRVYRGLKLSTPVNINNVNSFKDYIGVNLLPDEVPITPLNVRAANDIYLGVRAGQLDTTALQFNAFNTGGTANVPIEVKASKFEVSIAGASGFKINPDLSAEFTLTVKGQDGTDPDHFITNTKLSAKKAPALTAAALPTTASATYLQSDIQKLIDRLNDLESKLRAAPSGGLLA